MYAKWIDCAGCGRQIKEEWRGCPSCDANMGFEVWKSYCKKNKLIPTGIMAGFPLPERKEAMVCKV